jgi:CelD/BcsL family acetyltransferase involved in cellulose biosynthesis
MPLSAPLGSVGTTPIDPAIGSIRGLSYAMEPIGRTAAVAPLWQALAARVPHSFFQSWAWIGTWLDCLPRERRPQLLIGRRGGEVAMLGIITSSSRRLLRLWPIPTAHLNESGRPEEAILTIEHNGLLADPAIGPLALQEALAWAVREARLGELHLPGVPLHYVQAAAANEAFTRVLILADHYIDLDDLRRRGLDHSQAVSTNTRQQIKRAMKAAGGVGTGGAGVRLDRARTVGEALDWLDRLAGFHQAYWNGRGKPGAFANPFFCRFHRLLIERCFDAGAIDLLRVSAGGTEIGYLYNLVQDGVVNAYQSGLAYENLPRLRPGAVSHAMAIARALEEGAAQYDFLAGDSQFKRSFATHSRELAWIVMAQAAPMVRFEQLLRRVKARCRLT